MYSISASSITSNWLNKPAPPSSLVTTKLPHGSVGSKDPSYKAKKLSSSGEVNVTTSAPNVAPISNINV